MKTDRDGVEAFEMWYEEKWKGYYFVVRNEEVRIRVEKKQNIIRYDLEEDGNWVIHISNVCGCPVQVKK